MLGLELLPSVLRCLSNVSGGSTMSLVTLRAGAKPPGCIVMRFFGRERAVSRAVGRTADYADVVVEDTTVPVYCCLSGLQRLG